MKRGIRFKLLAILLLGSILPLVLGVLSLQFFGMRYYRQNQGLLFQSTAGQVAQTLGISVNTQVEKLSDWIFLSNLPARIGSTPAPVQTMPRAKAADNRWSRTSENSWPLKPILENALAVELRRFMQFNPFYRELLVTDANGFLTAASGKPTDYIQSDERWWKNVRELPARVASFEGIGYDASSKTYSLDIAFALRKNSGEFVGAVKGALDVSALYLVMPRGVVGETIKREVVLSDGRILSRLDNPDYVPLRNRYKDFPGVIANQRSYAAREQSENQNESRSAKDNHGEEQGWAVAALDLQMPGEAPPAPEDQLLGFAVLQFQSVDGKSVPVAGLQRMYVVVHQNQSEVLSPVRRQLWRLGLMGGVLLMALAALGLWLAERNIVAPLRILSHAMRDIAQTATLETGAVPDIATRHRARQAVEQCRALRSDDEISNLARDFADMGEQMLNYHDRLETEIAEKAGQILRDLEMAREFQVALVPREYPQFHPIAVAGAPPPLRLNFHHAYRAALEVGSDFFDVFKISEHQAGIFLADVMGHGARSALVTAALRTLLLDFSIQTNDPAELMRLINRHFYEIAQTSHQSVVVSAFCLVLDIQTHQVSYANAGHPSPLFAEGATARVLPLLGHSGDSGIHTNALLGAAIDTTYRCYEKTIAPGDAFLLYTDGVVAAPNPEGDEFGMVQLEHWVSRELARQPAQLNVTELCQTVMNALDEWMAGSPPHDDICLVAVGTDVQAIQTPQLL
jgi:serine phosphatase RsbU (regulator of sigma subunit)